MRTPRSKPSRLMRMKSSHGPWNQVAIILPSSCQTVRNRSQSPASRQTTQFSTRLRIRASSADVEGAECDVVCTGRFFDFLEKRDGTWGIVLRQPIYESDRIIPVDPASPPQLDRELLESFPVGYRHLAYLQTRNGFTVKPDMPGLQGPEVEALYASGRKWLMGENLDR